MAITLAHVPDVAWIIALYKLVHGGDPQPNERDVATTLGEQLVGYLGGKAGATVAVSKLEGAFKTVGLTMTASEGKAAATDGHRTEELLPIHQGTQVIRLCFGVGTGRQCIDVTIPKLARFSQSLTHFFSAK